MFGRSAIAALAAAAALAGCSDPLAPPSRGPAVEVVEVVRVVDGDTIRVALPGGEEPVRYIGIDTPEGYRPPVECFARAATRANRDLVAGRRVRLVYDVERRDRYGRLLAYVYTGDVFVNAELVKRGFAKAYPVRPNVAHRDRFRALEAVARASGRGRWSHCERGW